MKTIVSYFRKNRKYWELYLFPIIVCLAISALFTNSNSYVYTTEIKIVTETKNPKLSTFDTASISVYQTILKHPSIIISAQKALKQDYNISISQNDIVKSITTSPVLSGTSLNVKATNNDPQLATAIGKQVTKSLYYTLQAYLPEKKVSISNNTTLEGAREFGMWYAVLVSVVMGLSIGATIQFYLELRKSRVNKRRVSNGQKN